MTMTADGSLLETYATGRIEAAFSTLVERHLNAAYSAALRRVGGDAHLAEDVTQQVFAALAHNARKLSRHPVLSAWLFTTTRNVAAQLVRSERRRKGRETNFQTMDHIHQTAAEANWNQIGPVLDEVIDQLSEGDRRAVLLRFMERRGFAEIGNTLRLTEDAARMKVIVRLINYERSSNAGGSNRRRLLLGGFWCIRRSPPRRSASRQPSQPP
jgi:RNA polymerase sigma factor (sigma-70 family)